MKKKRLLICGISMPCAGTEKALLAFLNTIDRSTYDITLLLARHEGALLSELPSDLHLLGPMRFGDMFFLSSANAPQMPFSFMLAHPSAAPTILFYTLASIFQRSKLALFATTLWIKLMKRYCPSLEEEFHIADPFDLVLSFWGDRTMFYACDKVKAARHDTWLHFDFDHPKRDPALYHAYFAKCHRIISVTEECTRLLCSYFPGLSDRMITFENRISPSRIRVLAKETPPLSMQAAVPVKILTVARIAPQKGTDRIPRILSILKQRGIAVRWFLLGEGSEADTEALKKDAARLGVSDSLIFLGTASNPYPCFAACDIFVLPSRFEGKPITVEEAKILGCPIVVCDYLSARKQLGHGRLGIIAPQDEGEGIATALKALIESPSLRSQYQQACLDSVAALPGQGLSETECLLSQ